mgnify:CR=1 FL=1
MKIVECLEATLFGQHQATILKSLPALLLDYPKHSSALQTLFEFV